MDIKNSREVTGNTKQSLETTLGKKYTNICWTINNPDEKDYAMLHKLTEEPSFLYIIFQDEKGKNGTPHWQGYLELLNPVTLKWLKGFMPRAHIERRRGTQDEAIKYCTKEDTRSGRLYEFGIKKKQGQRKDLMQIKKELQDGKDMKYIADNYWGDWIRYNKSFEKYQLYLLEERKTPEVIVFIGAPGSGKTHIAKTMSEDYYIHQKGQWFDGYNGESTIIFEEFTGCIDMELINLICDKTKCRLPIKGGFVNCKAEKIIFTSNIPVKYWWTKDASSFGSRITYYVNGPWDTTNCTRKQLIQELDF